jgi:hypothetical protein
MTTDESRLAWQSMAAVEQARAWHAVDPEMARKLIAMTQQHEQHEQHLDWAYFALRVSGLVAGLASVVVLGVVAWHYANVHATGQGLAVFCSGAAAVASVFLGATGLRGAIKVRRAK